MDDCFWPSATVIEACFWPFCLGDNGASCPLGAHLAGHSLEDRRGRLDLSYLDVGHLHTPAFGDVVQFEPQDPFISSRLDRNIVQGHVADHRTQSGGAMLVAAPLKSWTASTEVSGSNTL